MDRDHPPHYYWAIPDRMIAGQHPGSTNPRQASVILTTLLSMQVSAFIDLTEEGEREPYEPLFEELQPPSVPTLLYYREPIMDRNIPTVEQMVRILDRIDAMLGEERVLYLHCFAGLGRTGTVLGCHLVRHGLSGEAALALIAERRRGNLYAHLTSPETEAQRQFVRVWQPGT